MDIDAFLAAEKSAGRVESQGAFTLALDKARQKLAEFQLEDNSFYILKFVQAAVASGASRIDLRTTRKRLALWFDTDEPIASFGALSEALRNPLEATPARLRHLAIGLNASVVQKPQQVSLVWWGKNDGRAFYIENDEFSGSAAPPRPDLDWGRENLYMLAVTKQASWFQSATAQEHATVTTRCCYAPVEFRIDGHLLEARAPKAQPGRWLAEYSHPFHLVERATEVAQGPIKARLPYLKWRKKKSSGWCVSDRLGSTFCVQPATETQNDEVKSDGLYTMPLGLQGYDTIHFVRHGVVAEVTPIREGAGAVAIVSADDLNFDLSGFSVQRDEKYLECIERVGAVWTNMLASVVNDLSYLKATNNPREKANKEAKDKQSCACSSCSCAAAIWLGGVLVWLPDAAGPWLMFGLPLLSFILPQFQKAEDPHDVLQSKVLERIDLLKEGGWPGEHSTSGAGSPRS